MKKFKKSFVATVMGIIMGVTLIGSTVSNAEEPCNHSYNVHLERYCYSTTNLGTHYHSGHTCVMTEYHYHNYGCCNRCGFILYTYDDTTEVVHKFVD